MFGSKSKKDHQWNHNYHIVTNDRNESKQDCSKVDEAEKEKLEDNDK